MHRMVHLGGVATSVLLAVACAGDDPQVEGQWQSTAPVGAAHNALVVEPDGTGRATLHIVYIENRMNVTGRFEFDAPWEASSEARFVFDMRCRSTPSGACETGDSFQMTCDLDEAETTLTCVGDNNWREYEFRWSR